MQSHAHLLRCYHSIELSPARAAMVAAPSEYPWFSYAANAQGTPDALLTPHQQHLPLSLDDAIRLTAYRAWLIEAVTSEELETIHEPQQRR